MNESRTTQPSLWALAVVGVALSTFAVAGALAIRGGVLWLDEGWYLLATTRVVEGQRPYSDFLFTQTPLLPYFYAALSPWLGVGVLADRCVSLSLGLASICLIFATCRSKAGWTGAIAGTCLAAFNLSLAFDFSTVRTQALTAFLTTLGLYLAGFVARPASSSAASASASDGRAAADERVARQVLGWPAWSMAAMTLAVLARLSMLPALVVIWAYCLWAAPNRLRTLACIAVNLAALAALAWWFGAGGNLVFNIYGFHRVFYGNAHWSPGMAYYFLSGFLRNQLPIVATIVCAAVIWWRTRDKQTSAQNGVDLGFLALVAGCYGLTTLLHGSRAVAFPHYQTSNVGFAAVLAGCLVAQIWSRIDSRRQRALMAAGGITLFAALPLQEYHVHWDGHGGLARLREVVDYLRAHKHPEGDTMLTWNPELSVEAQIPLLPSYEMSEFSFFPGMSAQEARKLRALTPELIAADLSSGRASIVCLSDRHRQLLEHAGVDVAGALEQRYAKAASFHDYGQFLDTLDVFVIKGRSAPQSAAIPGASR